MFAAPKTADLVTEDLVALIAPKADVPQKGNIDKGIPLEVIEVKIDDIINADDPINDPQIITDSPHVTPDSKPPTKNKKEKKVADRPTPPKNKVISKNKDPEVAKFKGSNIHIGFRVSNEMKEALEDMARDFAYLARKEYGIKIKDDTSSIQRAFLVLGMSCFTEKLRHKVLKEYDNESEMEDEVSQQLIALMRLHKVEIDDIDF